MRELPILFSAPMVRAILNGHKTQTRRLVKPYRGNALVDLRDAEDRSDIYSGRRDDPESWGYQFLDDGAPATLADWATILCPYGAPGDRLWVRERAAFYWGGWHYFADGPSEWGPDVSARTFNRSSIHMPRAACRLTLEITDVRVERLQGGDGELASESRYLAEGVSRIHHGDGDFYYSAFRNEPHPRNWIDAFDAWRELWTSINGQASWDADPWVWVITFKRITP